MKISSEYIPHLRFKDKNGKDYPEWEKIRLGELITHKSIRNKNGEINRLLTVSNLHGFIEQSEYFNNHRIASRDTLNYKIVERGDFAYNPSRINVGSIANLTEFDIGIISPMYIVFRCSNNLNENFLKHILKTHYFQHLIKTGTLGSVRDSLDFSTLADFKLKIPCIEEQEKIADFFDTVNNKLNLLEQQKYQFEQYKKGLMQQIFNKKIRFKDGGGYNYPNWQTYRLKELLTYEQPTRYITTCKQYCEKGSMPILTAGKTFILGYTNESDNRFTKLPVVIFDDFTTSKQFVNFEFKVKSSAMKILKFNKNIRPKVIYELLTQIQYKPRGHKRHWISEYQYLQISIPAIKEQERIEQVLNILDKIASIAKTNIIYWKLYKKGLMQRLFIQ
ncbi:MAG: restriction endonuclease subunit S [Candidatus Saccharibacteria bacterium]|nr:restriction endonuclease subunit S [Candidatus Saccharibacteria bacterium]